MAQNNEPALLTDNPMVNEFYDNTQSNIIRITDDKLKVILLENKETLVKNTDYIAPLTLLISLILTFCTTDFKDFFTISSNVWKGFYLFLTLGSGIWLFWEIRKKRESITINELIDKIRNPKNQIVGNNPTLAPKTTQSIIIHSARYGAEEKFVDLTQKIIELVGRNILEVKVSNEFAGIDPFPDKQKSLEISCSINGVNKGLTALEGATIKIE